MPTSIRPNAPRGAAALLGCVLAWPAAAATLSATPDDYVAKVAALQPGDTLQLAAGTYTRRLSLAAKAGTATAPIVIEGPAIQSAVFTSNDCCNTVQLDGTSHLVLRNLTLDGAGTDGAFGVDSRGASHHITLENLRIVNFGAQQQIVGISTKGPAWNWVIRGNTIIGAGTGMYFGNSDGTQPFVAGLIEYNVVLDTLGYNLQVKHQQPRPTGVGLPTGDSRTIIRHNVFSKRANASGGADARPNVLVGHFPASGPGVNDVYEIYGNLFHENPTEALFQGEGNLALYANLFVNSTGDAVNIQAQNGRPRSVAVYQNTVVATGTGIRISGADTAFVQRIVGNASFAAAPVAGPNQSGNVTAGYSAASTYLNAPFEAIGALDLYPKAGRLTGTALDLAPLQAFTDGRVDFNSNTRQGTFRGAYEGEGANPGWKLALSRKPAAGTTPAPAVTLTADPAQVSLQGSSTLTWSASGATACTASGGWSGAKATSGSQSVGPLAATTSYGLSCDGAGGVGTATVTVSVAGSQPAPAVTLNAAATTVAAGGTTTLSWQATGATQCTATGGWTGTRATTGNETVGPLVATTAFGLECTGAGGAASANTTVTVAAAPTLTFSAAPASVVEGGASTLTWSATQAISCTAGNGWAGNKAVQGSESTGALSAARTYTLNCSGAGGSVTQELTVQVTPPPASGGQASSGGGGGALDPRALFALGVLAAFRSVRRPRRVSTRR